MFTPTFEIARIVLSIAVGVCLGLTTTAIWISLTKARNLDSAEVMDEILPPLGVLYAFAVILLLAAVASPIRPNVIWIVPTALVAAVIGYILSGPTSATGAKLDSDAPVPVPARY